VKSKQKQFLFRVSIQNIQKPDEIQTKYGEIEKIKSAKSKQ
jgi:hypothetical protein